MKRRVRQFFEFGKFRLNVERSRLMRGDELVPLPPKAVALLLILVKHPGRAIEKEELLERIWPDTVVEDSNLTQTVHMLRKALGKYQDANVSIETLPRFGYRLVADVRELWIEGMESSPNLQLSSSTSNIEQGTAAATDGIHQTKEIIPLSSADSDPENSSLGQFTCVDESSMAHGDNQLEFGLFSSLRARGVAWLQKRGLKIIAKLLITLSQI